MRNKGNLLKYTFACYIHIIICVSNGVLPPYLEVLDNFTK